MDAIKYNIYPSLLDSYQGYLNSADIYDKYWGNSFAPPFTYEEFLIRQFDDLIDKINRVRKDLIKADMGTAFNEIVDCMILGRNSDVIKISTSKENGEVVFIIAELNGRKFRYPIALCREFASMYKDAIPQLFVEAEIDTNMGGVKLYGYLDELKPQSVHDIKTTGMYEAFKFKGNNQHLVYPYCLNQIGNKINVFSYDIAHIDSNISKDDPNPKEVTIRHLGTYQETYTYKADRDEDVLRERIESLIGFLEMNKHLITDKKIFNEL